MAKESIKWGSADTPVEAIQWGEADTPADAATPPAARATDAEIDSLSQAQAMQDAAAGRVTDTPRPSSVLEGRQMPEPAFNPAEGERLSRRANAEQVDIERAQQNAPSMLPGRADAARPTGDGIFGRAGDLIAAETNSAASGLGRHLATAAGAVGADDLADNLNARASAASDKSRRLNQGVELERAARHLATMEGFAPGSIVQDSKRFADNYLPKILAQGQQVPMALFGGLAPLVGMSYLSSYADARDAGKTPTEAFAYAVPQAAFEYAGEKLGGMGRLNSAFENAVASGFARDAAWRDLGKAFVAAGVKEVPSEEATFALQFINDKFSPVGLQPNAGWEDFKKGAAETAIVALGSGGMLAGAGRVISGSAGKTSPAEQQAAKIKRLREAGETGVADLLQRRMDRQSADTELAGLQLPAAQTPEFQDTYRGLRASGVKPAEAAARTAVVTDFRSAAAAAGMSEKAIAAALDAGQKKGLDELPGFLHRFTQSLAAKGAAQPVDIGAQLEAARDAGLDAATESLYSDVQQNMGDVRALEEQQSKPAEAVDNIERLLTPAAEPQAAAPAFETGNDIQITPESDAAHAAATSPLNDLPEPTLAQKDAGNYKVGRLRIAGMEISVENPQGSTRSGTDPDGKAWETPMRHHYGYFRQTTANDGDKLDVFVVPGTPEDYRGPVFVVDQIDPRTGKLDEHKTIIGAKTEAEAEQIYRSNYSADWQGLGAITRLPLPAFKAWAANGNKKEALGDIETSPQQTTQARQAAATLPADQAAAASDGPAGLQPGAVQPAGEVAGRGPADQPAAVEAPAEPAPSAADVGGGGEENQARGAAAEEVTQPAKPEPQIQATAEKPISQLSAADLLRAAADKMEGRPEKIEDLGEKIGGARKDTAMPTGRAPRKSAETDDRPTWAKRFQITEIVAGNDEGRWVIRDTRSLDWRKQPKQVGRETFVSKEAAEKALPLLAVAQKHRVVPATGPNGTQAWEIWRDISDRKRVKVVDLQFASRDDAMRYMAENATAIIEANTTFGEADLPVPENKQRIGAERRKGNVKGEDFRTTFGFRGVEFGNWNNQDERQQLMNEAYDGLMDLSDVMSIPPKAISLNGDLALAFGARGHGLSGARAHYEPDRAVMNLTKMKGAGALAHEWFHALDHYFGRQDGKAPVTWVTNKDGTRSLKVHSDFESNAVSSGFSRTNSGVREEVRAAYAKVMVTMARKAEQYVEDTAKTERFVSAVRNDVDQQLASIRRDLAEQKDVRYYKRNNKPATADQLAEFDAIAQRILAGEALDTELRAATGAKTLTGMRWSNDALEQISAIYKAVRGRSGFDGTDQSGILDRLRQRMSLYSARLKMLAEAQTGAEKTKQVPTDFSMDAKSLDQGRGTDYWTTPHEMAARAFQGYVEDKIAEGGGKSPFLNYGPENAGILTPWGAKRPYPAGAERKAINAAFDDLVKVIQTRETERGVAMFARGGTPDMLPVDDATAELVQEKGEPVASKMDAERRMSAGERLFGMHEQDETLSEFTSVEQLKNWADDQIIALPPSDAMARGMNTDAFRRAFSAPQMMSVDDAQKLINEITATWENGPKFKAVATAEDLPVKAPGDTRGWVSNNGTAYIVAGNHVSRDAIARTLAHEAIGHYGLWKILGQDGKANFERNLQLALKSGNKPLNAIRDKVRRLYVDDKGKFNLSPKEEANEIAAFAVEQAVDPVTGEFRTGFSWLKQTWARIAGFLRGLHIPVKFTNAELQGLLVASMKGLQAGQRLDGGAETLVAAARDVSTEGKALQALSQNDDLFALPKSDKTTVEEIAAEENPRIKVRKTKIGAETLYVLTMPGGEDAKLWVRPANPYGEQIYSMDLVDGDTSNVETGRPGENPEDVDQAVEDVYLDVSNLKEGGHGNELYNIASTFAHNTGRIFIGDPSGLSDKAMRRRLENMISTALKFGTTDHIAPHPRQVKGDAKLGVPPLRWVYGDSLGNIRRMIDASLKSEETGTLPKYEYDPATGNLTPVETGGRPVAEKSGPAGGGVPDVSGAPEQRGRTGARAAIFRALLRETGSGAQGDARGRDGLLARLVSVGNQFPDSVKGIFYARGSAEPAAGDTALARGTAAAMPPTGAPPESRAGQAEMFQPNGWSTPESTRTDRIIYDLQDGRVDLKRVQQAIEATGQKIEEKWDARLAETLYPGRVAYRSKTFLNAEVKPLLKAMAGNKVGMTELADYLHARGAEERNVQIAKVNPDLPDGGAGKNSKGVLMTTPAARDYLAAIPAERKAVLDALAKQVDAITAGTRKLLVADGLEKQDTIDAWEATYKNYVPMFRDEAETAQPPHPQGTGFAVRGKASRRATGSTKEVTNILAHVLMQREAAITRAEKNRVALSLYGQALTHPNPDFWTTIKPGMSNAQIATELQAMGVDPMTARAGMEGVPTIRTVDDATGKVIDRPNPLYKSLPGAIPLKVSGEDRVLMLNAGTERGARLAENLKNLDGLTRLDLANNIVGRSTRWIASMNTQYNPAFGLVNLTRDTLGGAINLGSTELRGKTLKVLTDAPFAIFGIARELATAKQTGKWGKLYRQFVADGGQTGYKELWRDPNDRARAIEKELSREGKLTPGKAAHAILDLLDGFNTTMESAIRVSAYAEALKQGMSRAEAARLGRELTVDFNRKGRAGRELGPLYAFFNASVQGAARTVETLKGPTGAKIIAGGLALGTMQALMMAVAGYDDDDIPEFVKTRSLIIPTNWSGEGKKTHVMIPYPLGLHVIPNTSRVLTELVLNGGKHIGRRAVEAVGEIAAAFNPLGGGNIFTAHGALSTVAPTVVDPIVDLAANKNFAGGNIERQGYGEADNRPGAARAKESTQRAATGQVYIGISKAINRMTGGTEYEAGMASPTPERVRYLAQTVGGGVLRELEKGINASTAAVRGDKVRSSQIPVIGRFYGEVDDDQVQTGRYFRNAEQLRRLDSSFKAMAKAGDAAAMEKLVKDNPDVALVPYLNEIQRSISELNKAAVLVIDDPKQLADIDAARAELMRGMNTTIKEMEKAAGRSTMSDRLKPEKKPEQTQTD